MSPLGLKCFVKKNNNNKEEGPDYTTSKSHYNSKYCVPIFPTMPPNEQQNYMAGQNRGLMMYKKKGGGLIFTTGINLRPARRVSE